MSAYSLPPANLSCSEISGTKTSWELASNLKEYGSRFDSAGVKLIAVGVGAPNKARILAEQLPFPMDCLYADPECKAYNVLGLYYGFGRTFFNPASAKVLSRFDDLREAVKNYSIEATPDDRSDVLQQGERLCSGGSVPHCKRGRTKAQVTMPHWLMFLISASELLLPDFASPLFALIALPSYAPSNSGFSLLFTPQF